MSHSKIGFFGPAPASERQRQALISHFGSGTEVIYLRQVRNAQRTVERCRNLKLDEAVMIAPNATLEHVLACGLKPLWSESELVDPSHPECEWNVGDRHFRFVCYKRLEALELDVEPATALTKKRPAKLLRLTRHRCEKSEREAIHSLYGNDVSIVEMSVQIRDATHVVELSKRYEADDLLIVAPLSIFGALCARRCFPLHSKMQALHSKMQGPRFEELRRVKGLNKRFSEL